MIKINFVLSGREEKKYVCYHNLYLIMWFILNYVMRYHCDSSTSLELDDVYLYLHACSAECKHTFPNLKTLFSLLVTHKENHQDRMPVNLKKPNSLYSVNIRSSSRTFHLEATGVGGKVQSKKKLYRLKSKTPTFTWLLKVSNTYFGL